MKRKIYYKIIDFCILNCLSYTVASLMLSILSSFGVVQNMDYRILVQLFFCMTVFSLLATFINGFLVKSRWTRFLTGLVNGTVIVLAIGGGVFHWFPWKTHYVVLVLLTFLLSYVIVYGFQLLENKKAVDQINQILMERKNNGRSC